MPYAVVKRGGGRRKFKTARGARWHQRRYGGRVVKVGKKRKAPKRRRKGGRRRSSGRRRRR